MMTVEEAVAGRRSIRAFLSTPVPRELIERVLAIAGRAPSGSNVQPWRVWVLQGAAREEIVRECVARYDRNEVSKREYDYYPVKWREPYLARRRACGWGLYGTLGIGRGDHAKSRAYRASNYDFFGAPVGLVFTIERKLEKGSWLDYGMFLQTLMLGARARGLHTCPEAAIASYPDIVRRELGIGPEWIVICGMALGYADPDALVNTYQPPRIDVEEYAVFLD